MHVRGEQHMAVETLWESGDAQSLDVAAQVLAEKFNLSFDKAKRLIELYRVVLARELKTTKRRYS
jgi:hypothetical protein